MTAPAWTARNPPPAPERDLWWHAQRIAAPDTGDHTARHRRGVVRLPWDLGDLGSAGDLIDPWVCCDPACGGVELSDAVLENNHACCVPARCCDEHADVGVSRGRHAAGLGTVRFRGWYHGPFTAFWEPGGTR